MMRAAAIAIIQIAFWTCVFWFASTQESKVAQTFLPVYFAPVSAALFVCTVIAFRRRPAAKAGEGQ